MTGLVLVTVAAFAALIIWLARRQLAGHRLATNVLIALVAGIVFGAAVQAAFGADVESRASALAWVNLVGSGYTRLLQLVVMPLVFVSILSAVAKLEDGRRLGASSAGVLGILLVTTAISAGIGVAVTRLFGLSAEGLVQGEREVARGERLVGQVGEISNLNVPNLLLDFIPTNIFSALAGGASSIIGVVVFAVLLGLAAVSLRRERPEVGNRIADGIDLVRELVMRLVRIIVRLTPYGVLALITRVVATSNGADILNLIGFVFASYLGLAAILLVHGGLLALAGLSPIRYFRKVWPALSFAFASRSSAATIPLNVEAQVNRVGVSPGIANLSAGFGATIGQNGCAGLYPAMLAVMIAPTVGINPADPGFILSVMLVSAIGSFGIAGVGGGATFAAILVLSTLNLPVALAGLLISIEPLIDMGRTAVNVNGAMTAGTLTSRILGELDTSVFEADEAVSPGSVIGVEAEIGAAV